MKERNKSLDTAKGLLIILMIIGHVFLEGRVRDFIYTFHMPTFLIITGILLTQSSSLNLPIGEFVKRKIKSLIIPFVFFEMLGIITDIICNGITLNAMGYMYNTLTQNWNNGAVGFLIHTFIAQLTFFTIFRFFSNRRIQVGIIAVLVVFAFLLPSSFHSIFRISFIYLGFLSEGFYVFHKLKSNSWTCFISLTLTILISFFGIYLSNCFGNLLNTIIFIIGANTGSYFILHLSKKLNSKILMYYGKNSIILLGTHNFILLPLRRYLSNSFSFSVSAFILITIIILEYPITLLLNKYTPSLVGRARKV